MKIYTRTGDTGETSLFSGDRARKDDPRVDAYGEIDELNAWLGFVRASQPDPALDQELVTLLAQLHDADTADEVDAERRALELLGGGCGMPLGIRAQRRDGALHIRAILGPDAWQLHDAPAFVRAEASGSTPAEVAERVIRALTTAQKN